MKVSYRNANIDNQEQHYDGYSDAAVLKKKDPLATTQQEIAATAYTGTKSPWERKRTATRRSRSLRMTRNLSRNMPYLVLERRVLAAEIIIRQNQKLPLIQFIAEFGRL